MTATSTRVRVTADDWAELRRRLFTSDGNENAAVLLCGSARMAREEALLVRTVLPVAENDYESRLPYHLRVSALFFNKVIDRSLADGLTPIITHSHPDATAAQYSASDDAGERRLSPVLTALLPGISPASLLVTQGQVAGRRFTGKRFEPLDKLTVTGLGTRTFPLVPRHDEQTGDRERWDRQILAFGPDAQRQLQNLRVSIVGCGGTGSAVAEQLARAGIDNIRLIDPEKIEASNVSRLYGATMRDLGRHKTIVIKRHLKRLGVGNVTTSTDTAIRQTTIESLRDSDLVFSCVDNDRSRALLNRFAHQYLVPLVDVGIRLDARNGKVTAAAGRVSVAGSGLLCLRCSHHIDPDRVRAESLPEVERRRLADEGYLMGIDLPVPAVVSLNTTMAGLAATAGLNLFVGLTGADQPLDQLYDGTTGTVFTAAARHQQGCDVCDPVAGAKAKGDAERVSAYD